MSYFTAESEQQKMYTQLPKALLYEDMYKSMSNDSKLLYSFLVDRVSLSLKNGFIDEQKRVYIKCSEITMGEILNKSEKTVRKFKKELMDKGLLEQPDAKNNKTMYYVKQPKVTVEKLEDYIADFQAVVKEKVKKELDRNKEYRLKQAHKKLAVLKAQNCNGNNDRSIENTEIQVENQLQPLETLATVKTTACEREKLPYSNNDFSNTDLKDCMYVSTPTWETIETPFIQLAKENQIAFNPEMKDIISSYEEVFSYELYEYMFYEILNKYRNGLVKNFELYLLRALDGQASRNQFTLSEYVSYKSEFNTKNYPRKDFNAPKYKTTKELPKPKKPEVNLEPVVKPEIEPVVISEEKPAKQFIPNYESPYTDKIAIFDFRKEHGLMNPDYAGMSLVELKEYVKNNK
ncbi:MAG: replication initiator protein A [Paraclostridium sp.]